MSKLKLAAKPLEIFLFISLKDWQKKDVDVRRQFYHAIGLETVNEILEFLKTENYITQNEAVYSTRDFGKQFF